MLLPSLRNLLASVSHPVRGSQKFPRHSGSAPIVERLEERCLLAVYTVTTTADAGPGSLRQAILDANATPGLDTIAFAIDDGGVQTIRPSTALPAITDPVIMDGTTEPGFAGQPLILLDGSNTKLAIGLTVSAGGSTIRGLVIQAFSVGIRLAGDNNIVAGNYLGTDITGTLAVANGTGVEVMSSNNVVGGTTAADRNLISGNSVDGISVFIPSGGGPALALPASGDPSGNRVEGNYIGTDISGTQALGNGTGVLLASSRNFSVNANLIGGSEDGAGNLISGNTTGITISASNSNVVQGNRIGTDVTGTHALGNRSYGIILGAAADNLIGGASALARNLISGNGIAGIDISLFSSNQVQGNWIGTDRSGTVALGNATGVLVEGSGTTLGGTQPGTGNLISGNLNYGIALTGSNNQVLGNTIGLDASGTQALRNIYGVYVTGGSNNRIGGLESGAGNVISGNFTGVVIFVSTGNRVQGNLIGTDAAGTHAASNLTGIDIRGTDTLVGGSEAGAGNLISGNSNIGVLISGSGTRVQGNTIGTDITGTHALPNADGITITAGTDGNTIGGTVAGAGNLISGNRDAGVVISSERNVVAGNTIGTDYSGTTALGDGTGVRVDGSNNTLGGTTVEARNLISGNLAVFPLSYGIYISGNANVIQGNYIGTDLSGSHALTNGVGVRIFGGQDNRIGGPSPGAANLISGNNYQGILIGQGRGTLVQGNRIGTDVSGTQALGNGDGVRIEGSLDNTVGGIAAGAGNLISGNGNGIVLSGDGTNAGGGDWIQGNYIGVDVTGSTALSNNTGIYDVSGGGNVIGGTEPGARNVISGNTFEGIDTGIYTFGGKTRVQGNYIGTDNTGTRALSNGRGIAAGYCLLGGTTPGAGNLISGNKSIGVRDGGATVQGNFIGTDVTGTHALGNAIGVEIDGSDLVLGGTEPGAGNLISGNTSIGVVLGFSFSPHGNRVQGNYIGTDVTGTLALGNGTGVFFDGFDRDNTIGGTERGSRNLISGNLGDGISIPFSSHNSILGNYIGTDVSGTLPLGNGGNGVSIGSGNGFPYESENNVGGTAAGAANRIAYNGQDGILVRFGTRNALRQNAIFANGGLGIELTNGGNNLQSSPVLNLASSDSSTLLVQGTLTSAPSTTFTIELFANTECDPSGFGEGERFLASITVVTDARGTADFTLILAIPIASGEFITATATDPSGNTSQFSNCVEVTMACPPWAPAGGGGSMVSSPLGVVGSGFPSSVPVRDRVSSGSSAVSVDTALPSQPRLDALFAAMGRESWRSSRIKDDGLTGTVTNLLDMLATLP